MQWCTYSEASRICVNAAAGTWGATILLATFQMSLDIYSILRPCEFNLWLNLYEACPLSPPCPLLREHRCHCNICDDDIWFCTWGLVFQGCFKQWTHRQHPSVSWIPSQPLFPVSLPFLHQVGGLPPCTLPTIKSLINNSPCGVTNVLKEDHTHPLLNFANLSKHSSVL